MPSLAKLERVEIGELIQSVDDGPDAADPREEKLMAAVRTLLNTRLADLKAEHATTIRAVHRLGACHPSMKGDENGSFRSDLPRNDKSRSRSR